MRIKNFKEFSDSVNESEWYYYKGKTPFSRWLRSVDHRLEPSWQTWKSGKKDEYGSDVWGKVLPLLGSLVAKSGAAVADFFSKGKDRDVYSKKSFGEMKKGKKEFLDDWEDQHFKDRKVTEKDAEDFYKSGVLRGKKYFGKDYDPKNPKNEGEKQYTDYFTSAMKKYYDRLK